VADPIVLDGVHQGGRRKVGQDFGH
jgi:hypothetical protein